MADKTKEPFGCAGFLGLCALIFVVGYGIYLFCIVFVGPESFGSAVISIVLMALFIGGLKFFAMK